MGRMWLVSSYHSLPFSFGNAEPRPSPGPDEDWFPDLYPSFSGERGAADQNLEGHRSQTAMPGILPSEGSSSSCIRWDKFRLWWSSWKGCWHSILATTVSFFCPVPSLHPEAELCLHCYLCGGGGDNMGKIWNPVNAETFTSDFMTEEEEIETRKLIFRALLSLLGRVRSLTMLRTQQKPSDAGPVQFPRRVLPAAAATSAWFHSGGASACVPPHTLRRQWTRLCGVSVVLWQRDVRWVSSTEGREWSNALCPAEWADPAALIDPAQACVSAAFLRFNEAFQFMPLTFGAHIQ